MYLPATLKNIFANAFEGCGIHRVYYYGDKNSWNEIEIYGGNDTLHNATIYYYSPDAPTEAGNYWYYDELGNTCIWAVENQYLKQSI